MPHNDICRATRMVLPLIITFAFILCLLSGCLSEQSNPDRIVDENTHGYYFDVYTTESKDQLRDTIIELTSFDDEIFFEIQNAAQERQFAVKVLLDYEQVKFTVDGDAHETYLINAEAQATSICGFRLTEPLDTAYNHTLTVIMIAGADVLTNKSNFEMSDHYSLAYNYLLKLGDSLSTAPPNQSFAETELVTEYQSTGLLFNADTENRSRIIPERELMVAPGEEIHLQYQVGGYEGVNEVAIVALLGLEQIELSGMSYLTCYTESGALVSGIASITAPMEIGEYEFMAWVIPNPFSPEENEFIMLDSAFRFTMVVG